MCCRGFVALLAGLLALCHGPLANAGLPETLERLRGGVVAVGTLQKTRQPPARLLGTGFAVADGRHVLTNAHVLAAPMAEAKGETLAVFVGHGRQAEARSARVVARDEEHDLALIEIGGTPLAALKLGDSRQVREGQAFAFTGFPIGVMLGLHPATHRALIAAITPIAIPANTTRELTPQRIRRLESPYTVFQLDAVAYPGNSGSPLYDPDSGAVVGILNSVFVKESKETLLERPSGISYAIPSEYARALLKAQGLGAAGM
jgi:S1-C subfamily serine protease